MMAWMNVPVLIWCLWLTPVILVGEQRSSDGGCAVVSSTASLGGPDHCPQDVKYAFSVHSGLASPLGALKEITGPGPTVNVDVVFPITSRWSSDVRLGYSRFPQTHGGGITRMMDLSGNVAFALFSSKRHWWFLNAGPGVYFFDPAQYKPGFNGGGGFGIPVTSSIIFEGTFNYHSTVTGPKKLAFMKTQLGIVTTQPALIRGSRVVWSSFGDMVQWLRHAWPQRP